MMRRIQKMLLSQHGYDRLNTITAIVFLTVFIAVGYQIYLGADLTSSTPGINQPFIPTSVQVFPQSLPLSDQLVYGIDVIASDGTTTRLGRFLHKTPNDLVTEQGQLIDNNVFSFPPDIQTPQAVRFSLLSPQQFSRPFDIPFLEGTFRNNRTVVQFQAAELSNASGAFMMATPTDNNTLVNETSGLWFGDVLQNRPFLALPSLGPGWVYEGWAVIDGQTITTGRFDDPLRADKFSGFSDTQAPAPNFPGEDFLRNPPRTVFPNLQFPVNLAGEEVRITVEPDVNGFDPTGASPFPTTFLSAKISTFLQPGRRSELERSFESFPKATVILR